MKLYKVDFKIDKNWCKQILASLSWFLGVQVVSVYSYIEPTRLLHMRMAVNSHALPVYKKNRIASLLCIFETTYTRVVLFKLNVYLFIVWQK